MASCLNLNSIVIKNDITYKYKFIWKPEEEFIGEIKYVNDFNNQSDKE